MNVQGMYDQAYQYFQEQHATAIQTKDDREVQDSLTNLGINTYLRGRHIEAAALLERALALTSKCAADQMNGKILSWMGCVYRQLGEYKRAIGVLAEAITLFIHRGTPWDLCNVIGDLGVTYFLQGGYVQAQACFQRALDLILCYSTSPMTAWMLYWLGTLAAEQGRIGEAAGLYDRAIKLLLLIRTPRFLYNALALQAGFFEQQGRLAEALTNAREAVALAQQHGLGAPVGAFWPQLRLIRLEVLLQRCTVAEGTQAIEQLRASWTTEEHQAALDYTLWQIEPAREHERQRAAAGFAALYAHTPNLLYRRCYHSLTGQQLPDPPALPELPEFVTQNLKPLDALLARTDQIYRMVRKTAQVG